MSQTSRIRTLVVDDSSFFANMLSEELEEKYGMETFCVTSGSDALGMLSETDIDCVVSDYDMPGMDGLELLQRLRERGIEIPFLLLMGRGDEEVASEAFSGGATDYLLKLEIMEDNEYRRLANTIENAVSQHQTQKKYELLLSNTPDYIAQISRDGELLAVNPAMTDAFGEKESDLIGESVSDLMPEGVGEMRLEMGREVIDEKETKTYEDSYEGRYFHNIFVPVDLHGEEESFQMISRDITRRKEREKELELQNERLDEFASVVSHDLLNPLNVAQGRLELARETGDDDEFDEVEEALERVENIVSDVLDLARQGQTVGETDEVSLKETVRQAWRNVHTKDASVEIDDRLGTVSADESRLREALENLFRNSVEHGGDDVSIHVGSIENGFYVEDDGEGISDEERENVFDHGYTTTDEGTGFGLSIVESIVEAHGWEIELESSDLGGPRFVVNTR
ncbi:MAG: response regulator [Halobacteria archaeon]|nr:response regulator [Halobacteria archaeon]